MLAGKIKKKKEGNNTPRLLLNEMENEKRAKK